MPSAPASPSRPRIVIAGGGAGGIELATRLGRSLGRRDAADVVLIDRDPTHVWKPLLHEVATGAMNADLDEVSYLSNSRANHYRFQLGTLSSIDRAARTVTLAAITDDDGAPVLPERHLAYDVLVLAIGSVSNDFGTPGVREHCYFLDSAHEAEAFRQALLYTFLRASQRGSAAEREVSVAIVGGGATGVELSAELYNAIEVINTYDELVHSSRELKVHLIEAGPRLLGALDERVSRSAHHELDSLGVEVHTSTQVARADEHGFVAADGARIAADLMVWAAGVKAPSLFRDLGLATARGDQLRVKKTLVSEDDARIFAIGDCAYCLQADNSPVPPRAQAAHQQASHLAANLRRHLRGQPMQPFRYRDFGSLVSLSRFQTIGSLMSGASSRGLFIEGWVARMSYASLYRMHQLAIHGVSRTGAQIVVDQINKWLRPRLKLH